MSPIARRVSSTARSNARGAISLPAGSESAARQRALLEREGVRFNATGRIPLSQFLWRP